MIYRGLLELFRTHHSMEDRIARLEAIAPMGFK